MTLGARRSDHWFAGADLPGFLHRASLTAAGISRAALDGRPVIGICNSWSELVSCNLHFRGLADAVRRGVLQAGGLPLEFPTMSLGENLLKPTAMLFRNLMAMDVEESIRGYPFDAVVLLGGCDKTVPAQLMGAASADVPTISVTGGPANPARFRGRELGVGTDLWAYVNELRAGRMSRTEFDELEAAAMPSAGHCPELGTAATMAAVTEALGMSLPGSATIPATDARRHAAAEAAGRRAVQLAHDDLRPSRILTAQAFDNAITVLMAFGGSTNAVIHLLALAGRAGVPLTLQRFDEISAVTPRIADIRPSGTRLFADLHEAGGVPALLAALAPLLHVDAVGVGGAALRDTLPERRTDTSTDTGEVIASLDAPFGPTGSLAVLRGTLAPDGAIIKTSAADPSLLRHRGPALVFDSVGELSHRIDDPALDVTEDTVLVLRNVGPIGGPGMPEWGQLPIPEKLLRRGVRDMVRISDARMSGTAFGTVVLHVAPEAKAGGPIGLLRTGDPVTLDTDARRLDIDIPSAELARRQATAASPTAHHTARGYQRLYAERVTQADQGCDFDFLRGDPRAPADTNLPTGLLSGWHGGW
ncbi:dihydroxy-acid dehydratase [Streptomyces mayteni]